MNATHSSQQISISAIRADAQAQARVAMNADAIQEYKEAYDAGRYLPPVVLYRDGPVFHLADGFHRHAAATAAGLVAILADVYEGTEQDARWHAIGANKTHGIRRTNADKRRAVEMALQLRPEMSDEAIADHAGVSREYVNRTRPQGVIKSHPDHRIGKDGKRYTLPPPPPRKGNPPPPRARAPKVVDAFGREVPANALPHWNRRDEIQEMLRRVSELRSVIRKARDNSDPLFLDCRSQDVVAWLDNTYSELKSCLPYVVCPTCGGMSDACRLCHGSRRGLISEFQYKTFIPEELKAITEKRNAAS